MIIKKQKNSPITVNQKIDYKDIELLSLFLTEQGKILPRRATGVTVQQQRKIAKAIKRARILSLLPFLSSNETNYKNRTNMGNPWKVRILLITSPRHTISVINAKFDY